MIFKNRKSEFLENDEGSLSVEAAIMAPVLIAALVAMFVSWDAFKTMNISKKATYTVADALSREKNPVTPSYLVAMHQTYDYLMARPEPHALRVTVLEKFKDPDTQDEWIEMIWSEGVGGIDGYQSLAPLKDRIPMFAPGDQMIIVESEQTWTPTFGIDIGQFRLRDVAISRPRFAAKLGWDASDGTGTEELLTSG